MSESISGKYDQNKQSSILSKTLSHNIDVADTKYQLSDIRLEGVKTTIKARSDNTGFIYIGTTDNITYQLDGGDSIDIRANPYDYYYYGDTGNDVIDLLIETDVERLLVDIMTNLLTPLSRRKSINIKEDLENKKEEKNNILSLLRR